MPPRVDNHHHDSMMDHEHDAHDGARHVCFSDKVRVRAIPNRDHVSRFQKDMYLSKGDLNQIRGNCISVVNQEDSGAEYNYYNKPAHLIGLEQYCPKESAERKRRRKIAIRAVIDHQNRLRRRPQGVSFEDWRLEGP